MKNIIYIRFSSSKKIHLSFNFFTLQQSSEDTKETYFSYLLEHLGLLEETAASKEAQVYFPTMNGLFLYLSSWVL